MFQLVLVAKCVRVCAEGIPSHISSLRRLGSVRDGLTLDVSVSASDTVEFLRRKSVLKEFLLILILCSFFTWVFYSATDTEGTVTYRW